MSILTEEAVYDKVRPRESDKERHQRHYWFHVHVSALRKVVKLGKFGRNQATSRIYGKC